MKPAWLEYKRFILAGLAIAVFAGWIAYMAADTQWPYDYDTANSYIIPSPAQDGDTITVKWKLAKVHRVCPGSNRRTLFDPRTRVILATYDPSPAAISVNIEEGYLNRTFTLPRRLVPPGELAEVGYRATVCYECNLLQRFFPMCIAAPELRFQAYGPEPIRGAPGATGPQGPRGATGGQ